MGSFGEQLSAARKAAHLTQDQLAEKVHVTRASVSHWENGRYVPDFNMIREISLVLNCRFDVNEQPAEAENEQSGKDPENSTETENKPEPAKKAGSFPHKVFLWIAAATVLLAVLLIVFLNRPSGTANSPGGFTAEADGRIYRIEDCKAVAPRKAGKPYLTINTETRVEHGENGDLWMYRFILHEDQGMPVHLQQIIQVAFAGERAIPQVYPESDLENLQIGPDIGANQTSTFSGGFPLEQKDVHGIGLMVYAADGDEESQVFTAYIPFPEQ